MKERGQELQQSLFLAMNPSPTKSSEMSLNYQQEAGSLFSEMMTGIQLRLSRQT